jgi:two-component system, NtrC family, response regulator
MDSKDSKFRNLPPNSIIEPPDSNLLHATHNTLHSSKQKLLVVEDDSSIATQMKWALAQDYEVLLAEDRATAIELFKQETPPVVTLDLGLPPHPGEVEEGFKALAEMLSQDGHVKIIVITGQGEKDNALKAVGEGAYDFLSKPIQIEELKVVLHRASYVSQLEREHHELQKHLSVESFGGMLGMSPQIQEVFASIRKVATTEVPVLITGESGTGKELVAKAIHRMSAREEGPFVVINCSAIPETLLESELFGYEKGAFTGAHMQRKGRFETAQGGTLFLDEIGELSLSLQVKLLRFLQEQRIERVGGREEIFVDVRIMAASNRDLKKRMEEGRFREDFYYRLGVVTISLPPLREREGDIMLLATALLHRYSVENKKKISGFTPQAVQAIETHHWSGNVRELENRIKRAVIMAEGSKITPQDLELVSQCAKYEGHGLKEARKGLEKDLILRTLSKTKGNLTKAAEELDISRPTLYELIEKLGINKKIGCRE